MANQFREVLIKSQQTKERKRQNALRRHRIRKEYLDSLKTAPCKDCGKTFPTCAMHFDHLPEHVKSFNISSWPRIHLSKRLLEAELQKCELVCACCHAVRTEARIVRKHVPIISRRPTHCKNGHILTDAYVTPSGARQCRICKKKYKEAWKARRKAGQTCIRLV